MTDCEIILQILKDYQWHNIIEIMKQGKPFSVNWAVRSRVSDLKKRGCIIESRIGKNGQAEYKLLWTYKIDDKGQLIFT